MKKESFKEKILRFLFMGIPKNYWHLIWLSLVQFISFILAPLTIVSLQILVYSDYVLKGKLTNNDKARHLFKIILAKFSALCGIAWIFNYEATQQAIAGTGLFSLLVNIWYVQMELGISIFVIFVALLVPVFKFIKKLKYKLKSLKTKLKKIPKNLRDPIKLD